jgi:hypothetical protein
LIYPWHPREGRHPIGVGRAGMPTLYRYNSALHLLFESLFEFVVGDREGRAERKPTTTCVFTKQRKGHLNSSSQVTTPLHALSCNWFLHYFPLLLLLTMSTDERNELLALTTWLKTFPNVEQIATDKENADEGKRDWFLSTNVAR